MNKEPIGLYIFRFVLGLGLFAFMCMLYWSSVLIEDSLKSLRSDVSQLKNDIFNIRTDVEKIHEDVLKSLLDSRIEKDIPSPEPALEKKISKNNYPNILQKDLFFAETLPRLLGSNFKPSGTFHQATVGKPDNLHPFSNWIRVAAWTDLCIPTVSRLEFGKYETYAPELAIRMEERVNKDTGVPEFWVFLRKDLFWQPLKKEFFSENFILAPQFLRKNQVTAEDFKFYHDALMNPHNQESGAVALRTYYDSIQEIEVIDKFTFVVRWKPEMVEDANGQKVPKIKFIAKQLTGGLRPLASFVYKYFANGKKIIEDDKASDAYRVNSVWAQNFSQHWAKNIIVSCGPWIFDGLTERQISFTRNPDYYFPLAALTSSIEEWFRNTPDAIWQDFKSNQIDTYTILPDQIAELETFLKSKEYQAQAEQGKAIRRLDYVARTYSYIGWNEAKPFFQSAKVRRAMTMAIDRKRIIRQNLNGMGIETTGHFYRYSPAYDETIKPWPFDLDQARRLLEEEGWYDRSGRGVIDKIIDGKQVPFQFSLTYYVKNPVTKSICEYIATSLKELGIAVSLNGVDIADLSATLDDKSFDAICLGWSLGLPPEDPRQLWDSSGAKEKGSSNTVGFANAEIDKIINQLDYEYDPKKRIELYHRFDAILHEEQPYTFLYTPKTALLYREYVQNVFIPADRQDLIPGANIAEPDSSIFWLKKR